MAKPISETIRMFQGGDFNIKAGELFASVLRGVEDTGKAGKLTITLDVKQQNGAVSVLAVFPPMPSDNSAVPATDSPLGGVLQGQAQNVHQAISRVHALMNAIRI